MKPFPKRTLTALMAIRSDTAPRGENAHMNPTQTHPGHYWHTNDPADLAFNESGSDQPQTIRCYNMQDHLNKGEFRDVPVAMLEYLGAGIFGEARPSGLASTTRWTGSSHRYGIYRNPCGLYRTGVAILECHGGGMHGYAFDNLVAGETWEHIAIHFAPEMVWNLCNQLAHAYSTARDAERHAICTAFLEGRLKSRRKGGKRWVQVLPRTLRTVDAQAAS